MMNRILLLTCLLALSYLSTAQIDTSIVMEDINISDSSIRALHNNSLQIENAFASGSIAQLIEQNSNTYIKNYGAGSLSTFSIRGGSAGQALVLWNGLPLHSPMLGLLDLSLIPSGAADKVSMTKGGSSAIWGSGAVSGVLALGNIKNKDYRISNSTSVGSFNTYNQNLTINLTSGKWTSTSKYIHESSDRNYEYQLSPLLPQVKQENAFYKRNHFFQDIYFDLDKKNLFAAHIWLYDASTQIPATTVQTKSASYQDDAAIRSILSYKHVSKNSIIESKAGIFRDHNNFYNPQTSLEALNVFNSWFGEVHGQIKQDDHTFSLGSTINYTQATSEGYKGSASEKRIGIFATHLFERWKLKIKSSLRQEVIDRNRIPLIPLIDISYHPIQEIVFRAKASRDFRNPTLNDRFWKPGGDPELLPENGWSKEIGVSFRKEINTITTSYTTNVFHRDIKNWILWTPGQNVPYWTAQNINNVISKGIEQTLSFSYKKKDLYLKLDMGYDYLSSAFQTSLTLPRVNAGDQLLYNPKHNARSSFSMKLKEWQLRYSHSLTGMTRGVNEELPSYHVGNLTVSYNSRIVNTAYSININLYNLFDRRYFIIERRPIAGRNFNIGITLKY